MKKRVFACALFFTATSAHAADWHLLTPNPGRPVYYDASSMQRDGYRARLWIRVDLRRDRSTRFRQTIELWSFDCRARTTFAISAMDYLPDGTSIQRRQMADDPLDYSPVVPGSVAETAMRVVCPEQR